MCGTFIGQDADGNNNTWQEGPRKDGGRHFAEKAANDLEEGADIESIASGRVLVWENRRRGRHGLVVDIEVREQDH
jgi:hypothetical protein